MISTPPMRSSYSAYVSMITPLNCWWILPLYLVYLVDKLQNKNMFDVSLGTMACYTWCQITMGNDTLGTRFLLKYSHKIALYLVCFPGYDALTTTNIVCSNVWRSWSRYDRTVHNRGCHGHHTSPDVSSVSACEQCLNSCIELCRTWMDDNSCACGWHDPPYYRGVWTSCHIRARDKRGCCLFDGWLHGPGDYDERKIPCQKNGNAEPADRVPCGHGTSGHDSVNTNSSMIAYKSHAQMCCEMVALKITLNTCLVVAFRALQCPRCIFRRPCSGLHKYSHGWIWSRDHDVIIIII